MNEILSHLLTADPSPHPIADVNQWWSRHHQDTAAFARPVERAMAGGFLADRPGYAFAAGYQEALAHLLGRPPDRKRALCATETDGNHPRAIATRLERNDHGTWRLHGHKQWITLGNRADELLVVASEGQHADGRNRLAVVCIPAARPGVSVEPMPAPPFVPEIPHARLHLDGVPVEDGERLPGDGYTHYLKPFRTVEDLHVHAALLAWLLQVGRRNDWPDTILEELLLLLAALHGLAAADPLGTGIHLALAGVVARTRTLLDELAPHWQHTDEPTRTRWHRDRMLLEVAGKARTRRREVAWQRLRATAPA